MKKILNEIEKWVKKNKGKVCFIGSFCAFDKKGEVKDDRIIGYGDKECIKLSLKEIDTFLKKDKEDFINW